MPFGEALERFVRTKQDEVAESVERGENEKAARGFPRTASTAEPQTQAKR